MVSKSFDPSEPLSLVWMRRDLRLHDHTALHEALLRDGNVQPVFVFDKDILAHFPSPRDKRVSFLIHTICHIHQQLVKAGGGLLVAYASAQDVIPKIAKQLQANTLVCAEDFEPATIARDATVEKYLRQGTEFAQVLDHLVLHPNAVLKDDGTPYKVFTPYSKAWRARLQKHSCNERSAKLEGRLADISALRDELRSLDDVQWLSPEDGVEALHKAMDYEPVSLGEWSVDDVDERLKRFIANDLSAYKDKRDMVCDEGTSKISPYLRFGLVSVRECLRLAFQYENEGANTWVKEIIWREFYAMILYHFPDVVEHEFQEKYRDSIDWVQDTERLEAFKHGKTGYPIVDAAMRQLLQTGWMHNRARMIVASFLTKDLHLDWRLGERHFADYLMDYELASNNGGWQWAASTGTDAQPYFRIFNPESQSKKFDPDGEYIKRWVPELAEINPKYLHAPHKNPDLFSKAHYPDPIVDHSVARERALKMYKEVS
ncbi:MAG: DNA photolyase family protein [Rickettsiales bacterium]|nr:DNA photolyase family protein [Rickettsiales bacterium]